MRARSLGAVLVMSFVIATASPGWCDVPMNVSGSDGALYQAIRNSNNTITVLRNGQPHSAQPGGLTPSLPAMTRVGSTLYLFVRGTENSLWCTKSVHPYTAWDPWKSVGGGTFDPPVIVSTGSVAYAFVRGADNFLHYANVTNCPQPASWIRPTTAVNIVTVPQAYADESGVYVSWGDSHGDFHRWRLGTTTFPHARRFGSDTDVTGAGVIVYSTSDERPPVGRNGYTPDVHKGIYAGSADPLVFLSNLCPSGTPPLLRMGGSQTAKCYVTDSNTGDFILQDRMFMTSGVLDVAEYKWRSCLVGSSFNLPTDGCDFSASVDFFPRLTDTTEVRLRARVTASAGANPAGSGAVSLVFRLKYLIGPFYPEIEMHLMPFYFAQGGCIEFGGDHDAGGRHMWWFTPACVGSQNLGNGQSRFYNLNLRSYISARITDFFRGTHQHIDNNPANWAVSWGLGYITAQIKGHQLITSVDDPTLEVLF